jgi:hypothetical protein
LQYPPKFIQIGICGLKIYHLATLLPPWKNVARKWSRRFNRWQKFRIVFFYTFRFHWKKLCQFRLLFK